MIIKDTLVLRRSRFWLVGWVGWNRDNSWFLRIQEMEVTRIMLKKKKNQMTDKSTSGEVWKDPFTQQANRRSPGHDKVR